MSRKCLSISLLGFMLQPNLRAIALTAAFLEESIGAIALPKGFFQGAPDLAVEVISPSNTFEEIHTKLVEVRLDAARFEWGADSPRPASNGLFPSSGASQVTVGFQS